MGRPYHLTVEDQPDPRDLALLEERLAAAAIAAVGAGEEQDFAIFARDDTGQIVAGASGSTWGGCCQIHTLWVDGPQRGHGLATELMAQAEATARRRGCRLVMGLTYDVLTQGFYDRLGYQTIGIIDNCPAGTTTRWYRKDLLSLGAGPADAMADTGVLDPETRPYIGNCCGTPSPPTGHSTPRQPLAVAHPAKCRC